VTRRFTAVPEDGGDRLDVALARWLGESRSRAARRIDEGQVTVDGAPAKRSLDLAGGERVEVAPPPPAPTGAAGVEPPPGRYEDAHVLVVAKPPGLVVHPAPGHPAGTLVQALAEAGYPLAPAGGDHRPGIVHRLDRDTSGLMVVAKTDAAHRALVDALRRRDVERRYRALVEGEMPGARGRVDAPIGRDPADRLRFAAVRDGKPARTRWEVAATGEVTVAGGPQGEERLPLTLVTCALETGRTHQIRVHLSFAGHPVCGDPTYGSRRDVAAALELARPFLHAERFVFTHPVDGERVEVEEPLPADLLRAARHAGVG
jgi:23S rRNA pseudouridine1911/1915/1917 synthase